MAPSAFVSESLIAFRAMSFESGRSKLTESGIPLEVFARSAHGLPHVHAKSIEFKMTCGRVMIVRPPASRDEEQLAVFRDDSPATSS